MFTRFVRWLVRKRRIFLIPAGAVVYIADPDKLLRDGYYISDWIFEDDARIIFGPPPETEPMPWRNVQLVIPDPNAPHGSPEFTLAMDLLGKGWQAPRLKSFPFRPQQPE
jgi:hypothetical protein